MPNDVQPRREDQSGTVQLENLTRRQLKDLEEKEKTPLEKAVELLIMVLPLGRRWRSIGWSPTTPPTKTP